MKKLNTLTLLHRLIALDFVYATIMISLRSYDILANLTGANNIYINVFLSALIICLNLATVIGMWRKKIWGYVLSYFAVGGTTLLFGLFYLPFIAYFFPHADRINLMIMTNGLLVLINALLHAYSWSRGK